jgi:hypothetical protein
MPGQWSIVKRRPNDLWRSSGKQFGATTFSCLYIPNCLNHTTPRMFADDTSVSYASNSVEELKNIMNSDLKNLNSWLTTNRLKDIGNQNFYFLYLIGILTEYLISYFCPFVAFSC